MLVSRIHYGHILGVAAILAPTLGLFAPLMVAPLAVITIFAATVTDLLRRSETPQIDWLFLAPFLLLFITLVLLYIPWVVHAIRLQVTNL